MKENTESAPFLTEEETPYFKLSKNEFGKMWLFYKPRDDRYQCWEPIDEEFWNEFEKLLSANAKIAELEKEIERLKNSLSGYRQSHHFDGDL